MSVINYITNLDVDESSGGWSGMNYNVYRQMSERFRVHLVQKIDPPYSITDRIISKALRVPGLKGSFPAFSRSRLRKIRKLVDAQSNQNAKLNFYHGSTPWLLTNNEVPYSAYLDCCFATYIRVYHNQNDFQEAQLKKIFCWEASFLSNAACIFFSSRWALEDTVKNYPVSGDNFHVAGLGGALEDNDGKRGKSKYFLFAGLDFFGKGGDKVVHAFSEVQKKYPEFGLKIVGEKPPADFLSFPNVEYAGRFDKSVKKELAELTSLFTNAYCFVLPTSKDMTPLVLAEAGSVGCPVIATDSFGISEIVKNNETGLLIDANRSMKEQLVHCMTEMIANKQMHSRLSENARDHIKNNFSWRRTGSLIGDKIAEVLS